jgi:copper(I)-binding protein
MKTFPNVAIVLAAAISVAIPLSAAAPAGEARITHGDITISSVWARATPKGARVGGGYMTLTNQGSRPDRLIGATFEASKRVEIHEMAIVNDIMTMRELPDGLEIEPGGKVELKPGSYHIMFMGLKRQLKQGDKVDGTLVFKHAGTVKVTYGVKAMGAKMGHGGHGKMKH